MTGGVLDPKVIERHLSALDGATSTLRQWREVSADTLRTDIPLQWAVLHGLQL